MLSSPNFACNSLETLSNHELTTLELQRFQTLLKLLPIELHARFGWRWCCRLPRVPQPGPVTLRSLRRPPHQWACCSVMASPISASHAVQSSPCVARWRRKRYKVRHARAKPAKSGHFGRAGRVLYRTWGEKGPAGRVLYRKRGRASRAGRVLSRRGTALVSCCRDFVACCAVSRRRAPADPAAHMPAGQRARQGALGQDWLGEPCSKNKSVNDFKTLKSKDYSHAATG